MSKLRGSYCWGYCNAFSFLSMQFMMYLRQNQGYLPCHQVNKTFIDTCLECDMAVMTLKYLHIHPYRSTIHWPSATQIPHTLHITHFTTLTHIITFLTFLTILKFLILLYSSYSSHSSHLYYSTLSSQSTHFSHF